MRTGMTLMTVIVLTFLIALVDFYWAGAFFIVAPIIIYNLWDEFFNILEGE